MEGFSKKENGTIVIEGAPAIDMYRLLVLRRSLKFEIDTGMSMTRAPLTKVAAQYGFTGRTKKAAYKYIDDLITAQTSAEETEAMA